MERTDKLSCGLRVMHREQRNASPSRMIAMISWVGQFVRDVEPCLLPPSLPPSLPLSPRTISSDSVHNLSKFLLHHEGFQWDVKISEHIVLARATSHYAD